MPGFPLGCAGRDSSPVRVVGGHRAGTGGHAVLALPLVDLAPNADPQPRPAWCRCSPLHPAGAAPHRCVGDEAFDHSRRVAARAELLMARLEAVRAMGTLDGELRPLAAFAD